MILKIMKIKWMGQLWFKCLIWGLHLIPLAYLSFAWFKDCSWVIILFAVFSYILFLGFKSGIVTLKILFFNISAVFFALFLYESFLWLTNASLSNDKSIKQSGDYKDCKYFAPHPYLGYGTRKDGVYTSKKTFKDEVIYDVSYTIRDGLRYTPNSNEESQNCVLFFGCSYTFGEGLSDSSTVPFYFNNFEKQKYRVINYGFHGYGAHQMLATIENRVAEDTKGCSGEKIAIYSFLPFHIERAAGHSTWDQSGPKYEIIDGELRNEGFFANLPKRIGELSKSYIFKRFYYEKKSSHYDLRRTIEIIKKSNELLLRQNVTLYVFVWDYPLLSENDYFINELQKNKIKILFLRKAIPDYGEKRNLYTLSDNDVHPNGLTNEKIAKYLYLQLNDYKQIIEEK